MSPRRLGAIGLVAVLLGACGAAQSGADSSSWHCAGGSADAARACESRGCVYGETMWCAGVAPPPEWDEQRERGELSCACTCQADVERCSMLP